MATITDPITGQTITIPTPGAGPLPPLPETDATTGSKIDPALQPYLTAGLDRLFGLTFGQGPSLYPGQTYVSPSDATNRALSMMESYAGAPSPVLSAGTDAYTSAMANLGRTASGSFLTGSPFLGAQIDAATRPIMQQFEQSTLPGIQSAFSKAGRYGSGAQTRAIGQAQESTSRAIGDVAAQLSAADYARERGFMEGASGRMLAGAELAPSIYAAGMAPAETLARVGGAREAIAGQPLEEAVRRYEFEQRTPYDLLSTFLSGVYGTPMSSSMYPAQPRSSSNTTAEILGAGTALYGSLPENAKNRIFDYFFPT